MGNERSGPLRESLARMRKYRECGKGAGGLVQRSKVKVPTFSCEKELVKFAAVAAAAGGIGGQIPGRTPHWIRLDARGEVVITSFLEGEG
jgi:hypothetical protein